MGIKNDNTKNEPAHDRRKFLCATGLLLLIAGQVILSKGPDFVSGQRPIDYAHWFLLTGAVSMLSFSSVLTKSTFHFIGTIITVIGVTAVIGMCTIDFMIWSFNAENSRNEFLTQLFNTPSVSIPFIKVGPSFLYVGLAIQSFSYLRTNFPGFILTVSGTIIIGIGQLIIHQRMVVVLGHIVFATGLVLVLYLKIKICNVREERHEKGF